MFFEYLCLMLHNGGKSRRRENVKNERKGKFNFKLVEYIQLCGFLSPVRNASKSLTNKVVSEVEPYTTAVVALTILAKASAQADIESSIADNFNGSI